MGDGFDPERAPELDGLPANVTARASSQLCHPTQTAIGFVCYPSNLAGLVIVGPPAVSPMEAEHSDYPSNVAGLVMEVDIRRVKSMPTSETSSSYTKLSQHVFKQACQSNLTARC